MSSQHSPSAKTPAKMAPLGKQAGDQFVSDFMGGPKAVLRMKQLLGGNTVYGIIGNQIFKRNRVFAGRVQVVSLMRKATMGMDELTDFSETPWQRPGASRTHEGGDWSCRGNRTKRGP